MVYINIQDTATVVYVPSNGWAYGLNELALTARNTVDRNEVTIPITQAKSAGFLVRMKVEVPEGLYAGEWEYELVAWENPVVNIATVLLVAYDGDKAPAVEYNSENKVIQYGG